MAVRIRPRRPFAPDSESGSLFWKFRLLDRAGHIPRPDCHRVDVVPGGWFAAAPMPLSSYLPRCLQRSGGRTIEVQSRPHPIPTRCGRVRSASPAGTMTKANQDWPEVENSG